MEEDPRESRHLRAGESLVEQLDSYKAALGREKRHSAEVQEAQDETLRTMAELIEERWPAGGRN